MKIKTKLCLVFGIILTLILAISTVYGLYSVDSISIKSNNQLLRTRANLKVKALNEKINVIFKTLEMAGREIAITGLNELDSEKAINTLKSIKTQLGVVEGYMGMENGDTYTDADGLLKDFNAKERQRPWYVKVFNDNKDFFIGAPYLSLTTNKIVFPAGVKVIRGDQKVAALCIDMELDGITNFITNISANKNFFLTNETGVIFASKNPDEIGKNLFEILPEFKDYNDKSAEEFDFIWKAEGEQKYKVVMNTLEKLGWHFWQYESYTIINKEADEYLERSIVFFVIALVISLVIIYIIARFIASPIIETANVLLEFASSGNTNLTENNKWSKRKDEIGIMANAFDDMIKVLHEKAKTAKEIASGNLQVNVKVLSKDDDLGNAFDQMVKDLNNILGRVNASVNQVTIGAGQISDSSNFLSDGATKQAASIEEITSSITVLSEQTKTNADNATCANQLAAQTADAAKDGQDRMNNLTAAMTEISNNAVETQKVIKTIDDIAFQTNLLALNAAVEAARAGTHGKGFAVVAEEVRNLAARSAKAAAETADLIQNSNNKINEGVEISAHTAEALSKIAENVVKTSTTIQEIATASNDQAEGISQIGIGLEQIDAVTQQNTANAEETASASEEMSSQAVMLQQLIHHFKLKGMVAEKKVKSLANSAKPVKKNVIRKKLPQNSGWGDINNPVNSASVVNPQEQIKLDDSEFGKF